MNYLLSMVVDVENLFMCVHKEEDPDNKQVYFYLFKLLRKCILQMTKPSVEGPLGTPPFEKPNIEKVRPLSDQHFTCDIQNHQLLVALK